MFATVSPTQLVGCLYRHTIACRVCTGTDCRLSDVHPDVVNLQKVGRPHLSRGSYAECVSLFACASMGRVVV